MIYLVLAISVPFLFLAGTVYNAIKAQKKLEQGVLKDILEQRAKEKEMAVRQSEELRSKSFHEDEDS